MTQTTLKIDGMMCGMCESHINDAIRKEFPVKKVTASHSKGICVIISDAPLDEARLRKTIDDTGYTLLEVQSEPYEKKGGLFKKGSEDKSASSNDTAKSSKKEDKPKKKRFQFFRDVKSEMKRVTWPTRTDVLRWSGVVVVALLFFGIFVALLDNVIITPLLVFISGIGA